MMLRFLKGRLVHVSLTDALVGGRYIATLDGYDGSPDEPPGPYSTVGVGETPTEAVEDLRFILDEMEN